MRLRIMRPRRVRRLTHGECDVLITRHTEFDFEGPSFDAAGDIADAGEAAAAEKLGHAQATTAVMAVDK